jgi:hypothetical protein
MSRNRVDAVLRWKKAACYQAVAEAAREEGRAEAVFVELVEDLTDSTL